MSDIRIPTPDELLRGATEEGQRALNTLPQRAAYALRGWRPGRNVSIDIPSGLPYGVGETFREEMAKSGWSVKEFHDQRDGDAFIIEAAKEKTQSDYWSSR